MYAVQYDVRVLCSVYTDVHVRRTQYVRHTCTAYMYAVHV